MWITALSSGPTQTNASSTALLVAIATVRDIPALTLSPGTDARSSLSTIFRNTPQFSLPVVSSESNGTGSPPTITDMIFLEGEKKSICSTQIVRVSGIPGAERFVVHDGAGPEAAVHVADSVDDIRLEFRGQAVQLVAPAASLYCPSAPQLRHSPGPSSALNVPASHATHASDPFCALNVPAGHAKHADPPVSFRYVPARQIWHVPVPLAAL
eukprot:1863152-Rhodomonas_salina.1